MDEAIAQLGWALANGTVPDGDYRATVRERRGLLRAREVVTSRFSDEEREAFQLNPPK